MLVIAGGIILGFFGILLILAFADQIAKAVAWAFLFAFALAVMGLTYWLFSSVPYLNDALGIVLTIGIFGGFAASTIMSLFSHTKLYFERFGVGGGLILGSVFFEVPAVLSYLFTLRSTSSDGSSWATAMVVLTLLWCLLCFVLVRTAMMLMAWRRRYRRKSWAKFRRPETVEIEPEKTA